MINILIILLDIYSKLHILKIFFNILDYWPFLFIVTIFRINKFIRS